MYPLPPELSAKILEILEPDDVKHLHDHMAKLLVRENRRLRQQVCEFWRDLSNTINRDDEPYDDMMAVAGSEFTCGYIVNKIIKPNVYFNTKDAADRAEAVERLIESLNEEDDETGLSN